MFGAAEYVIIGLLGLLLVALWWTRQEQNPHSQTRQLVTVLVQAAEQMVPGGDGAAKLDWVLAQADEVGLTKWLPASLLRAMIESAVYELRGGHVTVVAESDASTPQVGGVPAVYVGNPPRVTW